ncbi:hypothetical protein PG989_003967 [Apiospora arundinis]
MLPFEARLDGFDPSRVAVLELYGHIHVPGDRLASERFLQGLHVAAHGLLHLSEQNPELLAQRIVAAGLNNLADLGPLLLYRLLQAVKASVHRIETVFQALGVLSLLLVERLESLFVLSLPHDCFLLEHSIFGLELGSGNILLLDVLFFLFLHHITPIERADLRLVGVVSGFGLDYTRSNVRLGSVWLDMLTAVPGLGGFVVGAVVALHRRLIVHLSLFGWNIDTSRGVADRSK